MITEIQKVEQIPQEGLVVVVVLVGNRAPCVKYLNYFRQAMGILEDPKKNPANAKYFTLTWNNEVKTALNLHGMPTTIVYKDGEEKKRFVGHFWSQFEIAQFIGEGFAK